MKPNSLKFDSIDQSFTSICSTQNGKVVKMLPILITFFSEFLMGEK